MTMIHRTQPAFRVARNGSGAFAVRGYWFGYWFIPGVPVAMS
ncbi:MULTISPECIES: hypothetical protein [unclassified Halomonas]|nr:MULTISPECIES: hypothetical protein [unclassified Halomonas]